MRAVKSSLFGLALLFMGVVAQAQYIVKQSTAYTITLPDIVDNGGGGGTAHLSGLTGQTGTFYLTRVTGSSGAITKGASTNNIVEVDSVNSPGQYNLTITAAEDGALGFIKGYYKSANSDPCQFTIKVVAYDPDDPQRLGLTALPNAAAGALNGLPLGDASGRVALQPSDAVTMLTGVAQAGTTTSITLAAGGTSAVDGYYVGQLIKVYSATGANQVRLITGYVGATRVATVDSSWVTNPDATSVYAILVFRSPSIDSSGHVTLTGIEHGEVAADVKDGLNGAPPGSPAVGSVYSTLAKFSFTGSNVNSAPQADPTGVTTLLSRITGNIAPQSGDSYARLGAPNGASISADIAAVAASAVTQLLSATIDGTITVKQCNALMLSIIAGKYTLVRDTNAKTITATYYRVDRITPIAVMVGNYSDAGLTISASRPTITWSNLP